jgi:hypothetical protein
VHVVVEPVGHGEVVVLPVQIPHEIDLHRLLGRKNGRTSRPRENN